MSGSGVAWCRSGVVGLLAAWSLVLPVETLFRAPGYSRAAPLPPSIVRSGVEFLREPVGPLAAPLPDGVVVLDAADYRPRGGTSTIHLRRLGLSSSGTGVHLPVQTIGAALIGPGAVGRCVVLDDSGAITLQHDTEAEWKMWISRQDPGLWERLAWLAGLRPYRANECLWESLVVVQPQQQGDLFNQHEA